MLLDELSAEFGPWGYTEYSDVVGAASPRGGGGGGWFAGWFGGGDAATPSPAPAPRRAPRPLDARPGAVLVATCVVLLPVSGGATSGGDTAANASSRASAKGTALIILQNFDLDGSKASGEAGAGSVSLDVWLGGASPYSQRYDPHGAETRAQWAYGGFGRDLYASVATLFAAELRSGGGVLHSVSILDAQVMSGAGAAAQLACVQQGDAAHAADEALLALLVAVATEGCAPGGALSGSPAAEVRYALVLASPRDRKIVHAQRVLGGEARALKPSASGSRVAGSVALERLSDSSVALRAPFDATLCVRPACDAASGADDVALFYIALPRLEQMTYLWAGWGWRSAGAIGDRLRELTMPCRCPSAMLKGALGFVLPAGRGELIALVPSSGEHAGVLSFRALLAEPAAVGGGAGGGAVVGSGSAAGSAADDAVVEMFTVELMHCLEIYGRAARAASETLERVLQRLSAVDDRVRRDRAFVGDGAHFRLWAKAVLRVSTRVIDRVERSWATAAGAAAAAPAPLRSAALSGRQLLFSVLRDKRKQHGALIDLLRKVDLWSKVDIVLNGVSVWQVLAVHGEKLAAAYALCGLLLPESDEEGNIVVVAAGDAVAPSAGGGAADKGEGVGAALLERLPRLAQHCGAETRAEDHRRAREEMLLLAMLDVVDGADAGHDLSRVAAAMVESTFFSRVSRIEDIIPALVRRTRPCVAPDCALGRSIEAVGRYGVLGVLHAVVLSAAAYRGSASGRVFDMPSHWQRARGDDFGRHWRAEGRRPLLDCIQDALCMARSVLRRVDEERRGSGAPLAHQNARAEAVELTHDLGVFLIEGRAAALSLREGSAAGQEGSGAGGGMGGGAPTERSAIFYRCDCVEGGEGDAADVEEEEHTAVTTLLLFQASHHRSRDVLQASLPWAGSERDGGSAGSVGSARYFVSLYRASDLALISLDNEVATCEELELEPRAVVERRARGAVAEGAPPSDGEASLALRVILTEPARFLAEYDVDEASGALCSVVAIMRPHRDLRGPALPGAARRLRARGSHEGVSDVTRVARAYAVHPGSRRAQWMDSLRSAADASASGEAGAASAHLVRVAGATKSEALASLSKSPGDGAGDDAASAYCGVQRRSLLALAKLALLAARDDAPGAALPGGATTVKSEVVARARAVDAERAFGVACDVTFDVLWPEEEEGGAVALHKSPPPSLLALALAESVAQYDVLLRWAALQRELWASRFDDDDEDEEEKGAEAAVGDNALLPRRIRERLCLDKLTLRRFMWDHGDGFCEFARRWIQRKIAGACFSCS